VEGEKAIAFLAARCPANRYHLQSTGDPTDTSTGAPRANSGRSIIDDFISGITCGASGADDRERMAVARWI
jgi:hypothetical protein